MPINYSYFNEQNFGTRISIYVLQGVVDAFFPNVCQIQILSQRACDVSFIVSMNVLPYDLGAPQVVTSVFLGGSFPLLSSFLHGTLSLLFLLGEFLCIIIILVSLLFTCSVLVICFVWRFQASFKAVAVEAIIAHCDLSLIFFDYPWDGHLWPTFLPQPLIFVSCLVMMVLLIITVGLPVLLLMNHPNPLPCMYTSPTCQYFIFMQISYPTHTYPCDSLEWAMFIVLPMSVSCGLCPVSHRFGLGLCVKLS